MFTELKSYMSSIQNKYLKKLLHVFFVEDEAFIKAFKYSSAAKAVPNTFPVFAQTPEEILEELSR